MQKMIITAAALASAALAGAAAMALPGGDAPSVEPAGPRATVFDPFRVQRVPLASATPSPSPARPVVATGTVGGQAAAGPVRGQGGYVLGAISRPPLSPFRRPPLGPFRPDPNGDGVDTGTAGPRTASGRFGA